MKSIIFTGIVLITLLFSNVGISQENILLITPRDKDTIETKNPLLTWTVINTTGTQNPREEFRLILVELKKDQSAEAGVTINPPLLKINKLQGNQLFYPYDAPKLEEGHRYGWQIFKLSNNVMIDKSEAFEFTIAKKKDPEDIKYALLKKKYDGAPYSFSGNKLFFKMNSSASNQKLNAIILNKKGEIIKSSSKVDGAENNSDFTIISGGSNYYEIDISELELGWYELQVKDHKKQMYYLIFNKVK
jgi:hypothetical protein